MILPPLVFPGLTLSVCLPFSVYPFVCPSICLSLSLCLPFSVYPSVCLSICLSSISLPICVSCLSTHLLLTVCPISLSFSVSISKVLLEHLFSVCQPISLSFSVPLSISLFVHQSFYVCLHLFLPLFVRLSLLFTSMLVYVHLTTCHSHSLCLNVSLSSFHTVCL
jgi:hypothetical protein